MSVQAGQPLARGYHLEAGQTVGSWRIVAPMARGGMGGSTAQSHMHRTGLQSALKLCLLRAEADKTAERQLHLPSDDNYIAPSLEA